MRIETMYIKRINAYDPEDFYFWFNDFIDELIYQLIKTNFSNTLDVARLAEELIRERRNHLEQPINLSGESIEKRSRYFITQCVTDLISGGRDKFYSSMKWWCTSLLKS